MSGYFSGVSSVGVAIFILSRVLLPLCAQGYTGEQVYHLKRRSGVIASPGYPENYTNNLHIRWILSSSSPMRYVLNLTEYDIENSFECKNDYLLVMRWFDGGTQTVEPMICNSLRKSNNKTVIWDIMSYRIEVEFSSDRSVTSSGFFIEYEVLDVDNDVLCEKMSFINLTQVTISSALLGDLDRYPPNLDCSWTYAIQQDAEVHISFQRFHMEYYGQTCEKDRFAVQKQTAGEREETVGIFCGKRKQWDMVLQDLDTVRLNLKTDEFNNLGGFRLHLSLSYKSVFIADTIYKRMSGEVQAKIPILQSWITSATQGAVLSWHIRADPGFRIQVTAQYESKTQPGDTSLEIYDGPNDTYMDKTRYGPRRFTVNKTSSGFHVYIKAHLDELSQIQFLNMTYKTFNYFLTGHIAFRYLNVGDYTVAHIGPRLRCCSYNALAVKEGETVAFNLRNQGRFMGSANDRDCSIEGVVVYDGGFYPNQTIGPVCDTTIDRVYDIFTNFVSRSPTIFVFLYGYTNDEGRLSHYASELDPWPTTCSAQHVTEASLGTDTSDVAVKSQLTTNSQKSNINIYVRSSYNNDECFILFVHPFKNSEPTITFTLKRENPLVIVCERWAMKTEKVPFNKTLLPEGSTKYSSEMMCHGDGKISDDGKTVYVISGNNETTWSQRLGMLILGNDEHICGEAPECSQYTRFNRLDSPCGFITHSSTRCTWNLHDPDTRPFYWSIEMRYMTINWGQSHDICNLLVKEYINKGTVFMQTKFLCRELNLGRIRRYRAMEPYSDMWLCNENISNMKLRYAKQFLISENRSNLDKEARNLCQEGGAYFRHNCYYLRRTDQSLSWREARRSCLQNGSQLVSILSVEELNFLKRELLEKWNEEFFKEPFGVLFIGLTDAKQPGVYRWVGDEPLSVTDWFHPWDIDNNVVPFRPTLPVNTKLNQPEAESQKRCVAMAVGNIYYSSNWAKIPCLRKFPKASYICKWPVLNTRTSKRITEKSQTFNVSHLLNNNASSHANKEPLYGCPKNWTFVKGKCYAILTEDNTIFKPTPKWKAVPLCKEIGGDVAYSAYLSKSTLVHYLDLWGIKQGDGNVWLRHNSEQIGCTSMSTLHQDLSGGHDTHQAADCVLNEGRAKFILCERETIQLTASCPQHLFSCFDGTCLYYNRVCDGREDCLGGEDENGCGDFQDDLFYTCADNTIISASDVCDFWSDCADGSDEVGCQHRPCTSQEFRCRNKQCIPQEHKCDFISQCLDDSDEDSCDWGVEVCKGFECPGGMCLPLSRVTDLVSDCPDGSEADEMSDYHYRMDFYIMEDGELVSKTNHSAWCPGTTLSRRCHRDRLTCFNRGDVCLYDHDGYGNMMFCRDGNHLKNCENYECPSMFKCPKSYCIPWYKVCDGVKDCVGGADERNCQQYSCPGKLRCKRSYQCVTQEQICDGRVHCRGSWSDEQFCDLSTWNCPVGCKCRGYALDCENGNLTNVPDRLPVNTRVLLLQQNNLILDNSSSLNLQYLSVLRLSINNISNIPAGYFSRLLNLRTLDLRFNSITSLYSNIFDGLTRLVHLLLEGNFLRLLPAEGFVGLNSLRFLNLNGLGIERIETNAFLGLPGLKELDLSGNRISVLDSDFLPIPSILDLVNLSGNALDETEGEVLSKIATKKLWTDSFRFCCFVDRHLVDECYPSLGVFSSCEDLLSTVILRAIVWFLGIACVLGNTMVIVWRVYSGLHNRPVVYVINLSISDMFMGVYLIILASTDVYYRGNYILQDQTWRQGGVCQLLGILTTVSCQMSMFTLLTLAWDRFLAVKFPFSVTLHTTRGAWIVMVILWVFSLALALFPLAIQQHLDNFYGKNSICMPFNFTNPKLAGWEYATVVFVGLNGLCIAVIVALYAAIYCSVHDSQLNSGRKDRSDLVVARRLSIVLITNIISWIPIIFANIISVTAGPLTREMAAILTTVILPLNPAINPYLYTFSSCVKRDIK